jgi:cytochrome oxidase Cu insertion factor (SCO1/SenC/PrrC family)
MSTRIRLTVFLLFLALTACAGKTELKENQQKWATQNVSHYKFEVTIGCNCPWYNLMPLKIEVEDGQVISMTDNNGQPPPANYAETFNRVASIENLFAILDKAIGSASKVTVSYDPDYGYPKSIVIDYSKMVYDDEIGYYVKSFEALK